MFAKSSIVRTGLAVASACALSLLLVVSGCDNGDVTYDKPNTLPLAQLTPATACIVNSDNDVLVGGFNDKAGCANVVLKPSADNPTAFDEIVVADGGTLRIVGGDGAQSSASSAHTRATTATKPIEVSEICITNGGKVSFDLGSEDKPITSDKKVVLKFVGDRNSKTDQPGCSKDFRKGIEVMAGGSLLMYGAKGVPSRGSVSWTTLAKPAGTQVPGAKVPTTGTTTLVLTKDVTKFDQSKNGEPWQHGDWIVVATTDYDAFHSEFVQIDTVRSNPDGGSTVTLLQPLKYYHFGSLPPSPSSANDSNCKDPFDANKNQPTFLCDGANRNWGVDERAEVGLISRDIELIGVVPDAKDSLHWGGEIMIHKDFKEVAIQGVRLSKFGKDKRMSYPIHFHMVGTVGADQTVLLDANSIDHSYNHCVTIHSTSNLTLTNLVCARIVGHIFYEELESKNDSNPADDSNIVFNHNLGIGAMSHSFDIYDMGEHTRQELIDEYWWAGDYMTNAQCADYHSCNNYDGFNVPNTDNPMQATHGACFRPSNDGTGLWLLANAIPPCTDQQYYIEPPSGFWIQNPDTVLIGNSIVGCQADGVAYWWVPPELAVKLDSGKTVDLRLSPIGEVRGDKARACYHAYFAEGENNVQSGQLNPIKNGEDAHAVDAGPNIIAHFYDLTATHNRWRALWLRSLASPFVVNNGHFANNNRGATLLTSGGIEGNGPGIWHMIRDSVFVGVSQNNVNRWGPCPKIKALGVTNSGFQYGCIAFSHPPNGTAMHSGRIVGKGYADPARNDYAYQIYDGPVLIYHDRFINYNYNPALDSATLCSQSGGLDANLCAFSIQLTDADRAALGTWETTRNTHYEGDAALGWFPGNQNAYPTGSAVRELMWVNTNLRHQIFTDHVAIVSTFGDGDKNTVIIDEDGTLSGLGVKLASDAPPNHHPVHAFSLNNLPFNATSNSVDECFSRGAQNDAIEKRDTSLMSPTPIATLEFGNLYPYKEGPPWGEWPGMNTSHWQTMTFTRTDKVQGQNGMFHPSMSLFSRNGQGYWEPKVHKGYSYVVTVAPAPSTHSYPPGGQVTGLAGIYKWIDVGVADVIATNLSKDNPFYILLGISYATMNNSGTIITPDNKFTIKRGYKSYYGGTFHVGMSFANGKPNDLYDYFTNWTNCHQLDGKRPGSAVPNIPYKNGEAGCPAGGSDPHIGKGNFPPVTTLESVASFGDLTTNDGSPRLGKYYYNEQTGYLWLYIAQDEPNAKGPSPIGSCDTTYTNEIDPTCPTDESYYICPKNGCIIYTIAMNDPNYQPGTSPTFTKLPPAHLPPAPAKLNKLIRLDTNTEVTPVIQYDKFGVPFHIPAKSQPCKTTEPALPQEQSTSFAGRNDNDEPLAFQEHCDGTAHLPHLRHAAKSESNTVGAPYRNSPQKSPRRTACSTPQT